MKFLIKNIRISFFMFCFFILHIALVNASNIPSKTIENNTNFNQFSTFKISLISFSNLCFPLHKYDIAGIDFGIIDTRTDKMYGLQIAGVVSDNQIFSGAQISGLTSINSENFYGLQIAGLCSIAKEIKGVQIALFNNFGFNQGLQMGLVNIADNISGLQLGVYNFCKNLKGVQIGLINYSKKLGVFEMNTVPLVNIGV